MTLYNALKTLRILYEDNHIIVVYKEAGILSQEDQTHDLDLLTIIKQYIKTTANKPGNVYVGLVHRLDRMTEGVMVFAKTSKAAQRLNEQISNHSFIKYYLAVVEGVIPIGEHKTLVDYLFKDEKTFTSSISSEQEGKKAILEYDVLQNLMTESLIKVKLLTGRHHQIRVQMANINHPIHGDTLYGSKIKDNLMLAATHLEFLHPVLKTLMVYDVMPITSSWNKWLKQ